MDIGTRNKLSFIISKEKFTNNILLMLKNILPAFEEISLKHNKYLFDIIKEFANTGFNIEIDEPKPINLTHEEMIVGLFEDIKEYNNMIPNNTTELNHIISSLIDIKLYILTFLIFNSNK